MKLRILVSVALFAFVFALSAPADEASLVGTWTAQMAQGSGGGGGRNGGGGGGGGQRGGGGAQTYTFKMDGGKLSGTVSGMNGETPLSDVAVSGDSVSFSVTREMNGQSMTSKFAGKLSGDTISGSMDMGRGGPRDVTLTRSK